MGTPVRVVKNQYRGINAHLHSLLQTEGGWEEFHFLHIAHLATALAAQLRPLGYETAIEQSLQIRFAGEARHPESDVTIFDPDPERARRPATPLTPGAQDVAMLLPDLLALTDRQIQEYRAIAVYQGNLQRAPVAWLELLSPSNKPPAYDFRWYEEKRSNVLRSGIVFVEIDYLHQSPPTFSRLASYAPRRKTDRADAGAFPYRIAVIDPRPDFFDGQGLIRQFSVDAPIPVIRIPLSGSDQIDFDFDAPYQRTFAEKFYGDKVDYRQLPLNFDLYSDDDKARIVARMLAVLAAHAAGVNLEAAAPLPVEPLSLDEGLARLAVLNGE